MFTQNTEQYSQKLQSVIDLARTAARYPDTNVLITGETGTGKERIARLIHDSGARRDKMFCLVDCSSVAHFLFERLFFGYRKGSIDGMGKDMTGYFEMSNGGTLYLDNISYLPLTLQMKIMRVIEEKVVMRVGDNRPIPTQFRVISSTFTDLEQMVEDKLFRIDLYYRLNTLHIHIPALRERPEDIPVFLNEFVHLYARKLEKPVPVVSERTLQELIRYPFPGNIRELKNMTERAMIQSKGNELEIGHFLY